MVNATFSEEGPRPWRATRIRFGAMSLLIALLVVAAGASYWWLTRGRPQSVRARVMPETAGDDGWLKQPVNYPAVPEPPAPVLKDDSRELLESLLRKMEQQQLEIEALRRRQTAAPTQAQAEKKPQRQHAPMLFLERQLATPSGAEAPRYTLAPGATKIPCQVETAMSSDVEGYFTAKVTTGVWDTITGQHLLIPQNSTILAKYQSGDLLYGNERLPTLSLTLALPNGTTVDLGQSPITDQQGVAGLTGEVNRHFWRLVGAVFVGGALRGGAQLVQMGARDAGALGAVPAGIAQTGAQATSQPVRRALDTRPTITVEAGQLCNVLLIKPLELQAFMP